MKKLALGFLSVFMILGGVLFAACDKKVSLTLLTSEEITIYTNDDAAENYCKDSVEVKLENSSAGIRHEILKGSDIVSLSSVQQKPDGRYSFDIESLGNKKSGKAEVKISSIEDPSESKIVYVNVNTILERLDNVHDDNVDGKSNYYVVKGEIGNPKTAKDLNVKEFFEFNPTTANVYDVTWKIDDGSANGVSEYKDGETVLAKVEGTKLWVSTRYNKSTITLKATDSTKGANNTIDLAVLNNSTIQSFVLGGTEFYSPDANGNGEIIVGGKTFDLTRNNLSSLSSNLAGEIVVNTQYDVEITPVVCLDNRELSSGEWLEYFRIESGIEKDLLNQTATYSFVLNAYDDKFYNKFGSLDLQFDIKYKGYAYTISTEDVDITLNTYYQATGLELSNKSGDSLNNSSINVFSNYTTEDGYEIKGMLMPDDVGLDNNDFIIQIDVAQESLDGKLPNDFAKFYYRGRALVFSQKATGSSQYVSEGILSGSSVFVVATETYDVLENVRVEFVPCSNPEKDTFIDMSFYKVSSGDTIDVEDLDADESEFYISSSLSSNRKINLAFQISGLSTEKGLSIQNDNPKFVFSPLSLLDKGETASGVPYVTVMFSIELTDYGFEDSTKFYFQHISGKYSNAFVANAFVPLEYASILNNDNSATNAFNERLEYQDFIIGTSGAIVHDEESKNQSLSSIMLEAGTSLPVLTDLRNATLAEDGIQYKYLSYDNLVSSLIASGVADDTNAEAIAISMIKNQNFEIDGTTYKSIEYVALNYFNVFEKIEDLVSPSFSFTKDKLVLIDKEFKGFVSAVYQGYDETHTEKALVRFFAIESFNRVTNLSSNVSTARLYTSETLSFADMSKSYVDVTLSFRIDNKIPTYTNDPSLLTFTSGQNASRVQDPFVDVNGIVFENDGSFSPKDGFYAANSYYSISDMSFTNEGRSFRFRITANSTKMQTQIRDILKIKYLDENGFEKETEIQIEIKNVKRMESVEWTTRTTDGEIYLNLTSPFESEKNFTISTSFTPSDANDAGLSYIYSPTSGTASDLRITTSSIGQTFNLNLNTSKGGYGYLYLLPNDMIKVVAGTRQVLVYKYGTDADGNVTETAIFKKLSDISQYYAQLVDPEKATAEFDQYFLNNDGKKIYYKDLIIQIKITIADGADESTAIRVYSQTDLEAIDYGKYYRVMNNITLEGWDTLAANEFSGMLFGNNDDITLTFKDDSKSLFDKIARKGIVKNLTLAGNVLGNGFIADINEGLIENVDIDVYYDGNIYYSSALTAAPGEDYVGAFVGYNAGTIKNSNNYGVTIKAAQSNYAGGIAGSNSGTIVGCSAEFYDFVDAAENSYKNTIDTEYIDAISGSKTSRTVIGGLVGSATSSSYIKQSYVYAYSLLGSEKGVSNIFKNSIIAKGAFIGKASAGATIDESFAYVGDLMTPFVTDGMQMVNVINSYLTFYNSGISVLTTAIFENSQFAVGAGGTYSGATTLVESDIGNSTAWSNLVGEYGLDDDIWQVEDIDESVNFGFMYLKNVQQSRAKDVASLKIQDIEEPYIKSLAINDAGKTGILFAYNTVKNIVDGFEISALNNLNTISIQDLFGITNDEAKTLLLTTSSRDISLSANSIKVLNSNLTEFEIVAHSKMNFANTETFKFVILNNLPKITMSLDAQVLRDDQVVMLQTGVQNSRTVILSLDNSIYLGGDEFYEAKTNEYAFVVDALNNDAPGGGKYISISKSGRKIVLTGLNSQENSITDVTTKLYVVGLEDAYNNKLKEIKANKFGVSVFNGATSLVLNDTSDLAIRPSDFATFEVEMLTDNANDNIILSLEYDEVEIIDDDLTDNYAKFVVDSHLSIEASWTVETDVTNAKLKTFNVLIRVSNDTKHLVLKEYDLGLKVNALSLKDDNKFLRSLPLYIKTQNINDLDILAYNIESRQIKNSILYLNPSSEKINTFAPSSDAILAVIVDPAYAMMSHFTLTYTLSGSDAAIGAVNISKLLYNPQYGYYINTAGTTLIENGIRVNISEADKSGSGVYYFRIYISGGFRSSNDLKFTLNYYNNGEIIKTASQNYSIDYLETATVKVNNVSNYIMPKGTMATVTVTLGLDQELYDLRLQNNGAGISLSAYKKEVFDSYKRYTATLVAYVDAVLSNGVENGVFYVEASVARVINGTTEIKSSKAAVYLVDFTVDGSAIKVSSSGATSTYNGKSYDVFYAYVNGTYSLRFDYSLLPETYIYDKNDSTEVEKIAEYEREKNVFLQNNYYKDDEAKYYINHQYNYKTGEYDAVTLKQQLSYAVDENTSTKIYNGKYIIQNDKFSIQDDVESKQLNISGVRTGKQLMKLQTTIICQGIEFVYDYYFLIVVDVWSDEEAPTQIHNGQNFIDLVTKSEKADDYILMNDIVIDNHTPIDTSLIDSLDGNGYTIHLNSFAVQEGNALNLAMFNKVEKNTTLKNVRVNIYNSGVINVDISQYKTIRIAGFALNNYGTIYNCEVVSYYDETYSVSKRSGNGIVVNYMMGANTDPINLTNAMNISSSVSGFIDTNNGSVMNSRVGGESFKRVITVDETNYIKTEITNVFTIKAQGKVAGFVNSNGTSKAIDDADDTGVNIGYISACFVSNVEILNGMDSVTSITAGFAVHNFNYIQGSYVEGKGGASKIYNLDTKISAIGYIAGFVYENDGLVKNAYANIAIDNSESKGSYVAGFVYLNNEGAEVRLCFAACDIERRDVNEMQFSGVDEMVGSLNNGTIEFSYYYNVETDDSTNEKKIATGPMAVNIIEQETFYGFSFASGGNYNGIWDIKDGKPTLVSANQIAISNRYAVTTGVITNVFYSKSILNYETLEIVDLSYGSSYNPIIIRNAEEFAKATGKATSKEISAYKEYYNDKEVFGHYRLVNNIDMSEIDQNTEGEGVVKLTTTTKKFKNGLIDGNGFTISNINLASNEIRENYGLFAKIENSVIMNLDLIVDSIQNKQANIVGTFAGTAVDTRIISINITPVKGSGDTKVFGNNVVGGVVGMLFGESKINDVTSRNVTVYSSYFETEKGIDSNKEFIGMDLRQDVEDKNSLVSKVSNISYAGGVVGYVDVYNQISDSTIQFSQAPDVSRFNVVTVHVYDSVDIYGEVAGGLFGYTGPTTMLYDATIQLNAKMDVVQNPSYIISKNLYAGGLVGENYGGIFACYASYEEKLQQEIEENEHRYYNGDLSAERGQQSIFSYASKTENTQENTNDPLFIGGLVGYMGGGYIYVGYNKLNVASYSANTIAVGGIIGYAGNMERLIDLGFTKDKLTTNILLHDVFASGDIFVTNVESKRFKDKENVIYQQGFSAGIIGAMQNSPNDAERVIIAMKNVLAVNYYSYNGRQLTADVGELNASGEYCANRHYMLIGKVLAPSDPNDTGRKNFVEVETLDGYIYLISAQDASYNVYDQSGSYASSDSGSATVGGYQKVVIDKSVSLNVNPYGFKISLKAGKTEKDNLLDVINIGNASMENFATAHSQLYAYFLPVGWVPDYWEHKTDSLFPNVHLLPKNDVLFLDAIFENDPKSKANALSVLTLMNNSNLTVVVRGKEDPDDQTNKTSLDVNLTLLGDSFETITGFTGRLMSYTEYNNNDEEKELGKVKDTYVMTDASGNNLRGGNSGRDVGIILNKSMFDGLSSGASVEGVPFYLEGESDKVDYNLIDGKVTDSSFDKVQVYLNDNVEIDNGTSGSNTFGLFADEIANSSLTGVEILFRDGSPSVKIAADTEQDDIYMGLLAGKVTQESTYNRVIFNQIKISAVDGSLSKVDEVIDKKITVNYIPKGAKETVYAGIYAGQFAKIAGASELLNLSISPLKNIELNIEGNGEDNNIYVGGYAGSLIDVDSVNVLNEVSESGEHKVAGPVSNMISIVQKSNAQEVFAGMLFGMTQGGTLALKNPSSQSGAGASHQYLYRGGVYQGDGINTKRAHIGGLIGQSSSIVTVSGLTVDFNIGKFGLASPTDDSTDPENTTNANVRRTELEENKAEYKMEYGAHKAYSYSVSGVLSGSGLDGLGDHHFGGLVGNSNGSINITGAIGVEGLIDINQGDARNMSVGAMIGKSTGILYTTDLSSENNLDIAVNSNNDDADLVETYIGGLLGYYAKVQSEEIGLSTANDTVTTNQGSSSYSKYNGNIVSNAKKLYVGGGIGYVEPETNTSSNVNKINLSNLVFGGAVKLYGDAINGGSLNVGGIVGAFNLDATATVSDDENIYNISNCYSYGDVFINYPTEHNYKLKTYNFGGIVGSATKLNIFDNYSIMTSFNNRLASSGTEGSFDIGAYNVGAIVGANAEIVKYGTNDGTQDQNYYSSGASMAYQEQSGNIDAIYAAGYSVEDYGSGSYMGYNNSTNVKADVEKSSKTLLSGECFGQFASTAGTKLNPLIIDGDGNKLVEWSDSFVLNKGDEEQELSARTHNIGWISVTKDIVNTKAIATDLTNFAIVGNGHTITRQDKNGNSTNAYDNVSADSAYGGLVDKMGTANSNGDQNFNMISGLVVNLDVLADLNADESLSEIPAPSYGGVVGTANGNSFVYGVSVRGELSVGGAGASLNLSGVVGKMTNGFINECSVDANILYRANDSGKISGIAYLVNEKTTIKACYTAGRLETYQNEISVYALASAIKDSTITTITHDIVDCFSISNIKRNNVDASGDDGKNYFSAKSGETINVNDFFFVKENGIIGKDGENIEGHEKTVDDMAFDYTTAKDSQGESAKPTLLSSTVKDAGGIYNGAAYSTWYFSPYVNYGFASHGFGYMKNVTVYTRGENIEDTVADESYELNSDGEEVLKGEVSLYNYVPLQYSGFFNETGVKTYQDNWYLGVYNAGKFKHMVEAVENKIVDSEDYSAGYKFIFTDDIVMMSEFADVLGKDIGESKTDTDQNLVIDGRNYTIDLSYTQVSAIDKGVFGNIVGDIINLKINEICINTDRTDTFGSLANKVTGNLNNIAVVGDLSSSKSVYLGGVVGVLDGNATAVEAVVNISNNAFGSIAGGVVGWFVGEDNEISYSSNSGMIINTNSNTKEDGDNYIIKYGGAAGDEVSTITKTSAIAERNSFTKLEGKVGEIEKTVSAYHSISGGIVGYANGGTISNSYNANAVLDGYTTTTVGNYIAGGVVGYSAGTNISNSYNTGLVGAGNYSNVLTEVQKTDKDGNAIQDIVGGFAFAGGIFGYGNGATNAQDCINDGAVEAIGYMVEKPDEGTNFIIDYYIDPTNTTNTSLNTTEFEKDPRNLELVYIIVYNPGSARRVYAYGIGTIGIDQLNQTESNSGAKIENCKSSSENIKNDGNIGQIGDIKRMTFDRKAILNNAEDSLFKGKFNIETKDDKVKYNVNGIDSYLFPSRIYVKDTMTRGYFGGGGTHNLYGAGSQSVDNEIELNERWSFDGESTDEDAVWNWSDRWVSEHNRKFEVDTRYDFENEVYILKDHPTTVYRNGTYQEFNFMLESASKNNYEQQITPIGTNLFGDDIGEALNIFGQNYTNISEQDKIKDINNGYFSEADYLMQADTTFYSSAEFVGYDKILEGEKIGGIIGFVTQGDSEVTNYSAAQDINNKIAKIDQKQDLNKNLIDTTINGVETAIVSKSDSLFGVYNPYKIETTFVLPEDVNTDLLNSNSVIIDKIYSADGTNYTELLQYKTVNIDATSSEPKVVITAYLSSDPNKTMGMDITINYTTLSQEISLGKNNVSIDANSIKIMLEDDDYDLFNTVQLFKNSSTADNIYYEIDKMIIKNNAGTPVITFNNTYSNNFGIESVDGRNKAYFILSSIDAKFGSLFDLFDETSCEEYSLSITTKYIIKSNSSKDLEVKTQAPISSNYTIGSLNATTLTFNEMANGTASHVIPTIDNYVQTGTGGITVDAEAMYNALYNDTDYASLKPTKFVIGNYDTVMGPGSEANTWGISFDGDIWKYWESNGEHIETDNPNEISFSSVSALNIFNAQIWYSKLGSETFISTTSLATLGDETKNGILFDVEGLIYKTPSGDFGTIEYSGQTYGRYIGSDLSSAVGVSNVSSTTIAGVSFASAEMSYTPDETSGILVSLKNKKAKIGYEVVVKDSSGNFKNLRQGVAVYDETTPFIEFTGLTFGDVITLIYRTNSEFDFEEYTENGVDADGNPTKTSYKNPSYLISDDLEFSTEKTSTATSQTRIKYIAKKGTMKCESCDLNSNFVCTIRESTDFNSLSNSLKSYACEYYIFDCSHIMVVYTKYTDGELNYANKYIYYGGNNIEKYTGIQQTIEVEKDDGSTSTECVEAVDWQTTPETIQFSGFEDLNVDENNKVDVIVGDFSADEIFFIKGSAPNTVKGSCETETEGISISDGIRLYSKQKHEKDLTKDDHGNAITNSLPQYLRPSADGSYDDNRWIQGNKIEAQTYSPVTYKYRYSKTSDMTSQGLSVQSISDETDKVFQIVVLNNDISLENKGILGKNTKTLYGNKKVIKFSYEFDTMSSTFLNNDTAGIIHSLKIVGGMTGSIGNNRKFEYDIVYDAGSLNTGIIDGAGQIKDVSIYGNIRNVSYDYKYYWYSPYQRKTMSMFANLAEATNLKSYVSVTGLSNVSIKDSLSNDAGTSSKLKDNLSKNIVTTKDGDNGSNGVFGDRNGYDGAYAGDVSVEDAFEGYARAGIGGLGGYGANGMHGMTVGTGGSGGGAPGEGGQSGTVDDSEHKLSRREVPLRYMQYGGNGGVGAVGDLTHTSGGGGGAGGFYDNTSSGEISGVAGLDGQDGNKIDANMFKTEYGSLRTPRTAWGVRYGYVFDLEKHYLGSKDGLLDKMIGFYDEVDEMTLTWGDILLWLTEYRPVYRNIWIAQLNGGANTIKTNTKITMSKNPYVSGAGGSGEGEYGSGDGGYYSKTVNVSTQIKIVATGFLLHSMWEIANDQIKTVIWTSGEWMNQGGGAGYASSYSA